MAKKLKDYYDIEYLEYLAFLIAKKCESFKMTAFRKSDKLRGENEIS